MQRDIYRLDEKYCFQVTFKNVQWNTVIVQISNVRFIRGTA